jgi:hypothetical protein
MQPTKIIITLLAFIIFGIVVGSNLSVMMTVVMLNQPTVALPIGIWLAIAVGFGLLSSSSIQLLIFLQRRSLTKKIIQLQTRLQAQDEAIFSFTEPQEPKPASVPEQPKTPPKRERFSFRKTPRESEANVTNQPPAKPVVPQADDWDDAPKANRQLDWDDIPPSEPKTSVNSRSTVEPDRVNSKYSQNREPEFGPIDEVYDADFRLIQPPYKEQLEPEKFRYVEEDDEDEYAEEYNLPEPLKPKQYNRQNDRDDEDWGFDFDEEPQQNKPSKKNKYL